MLLLKDIDIAYRKNASVSSYSDLFNMMYHLIQVNLGCSKP